MKTYFYELRMCPPTKVGPMDMPPSSTVEVEKVMIEYGYEDGSAVIVSAWREPSGDAIEFTDDEREKIEVRITEQRYHEDHRGKDEDYA